MSSVGTPCKRVDEADLRQHLGNEQRGEQPEIREHGSERDVHPSFDEEEGREKGERDDTHPLLLLTMLLVVAAHHETEHERRQHGMSV